MNPPLPLPPAVHRVEKVNIDEVWYDIVDFPEEWGDEDYTREEGFRKEETAMLEIWERWFPLPRDPSLHAAGVEIGARTKYLTELPPKLLLTFRASGKEASFDCNCSIEKYAASIENHPPEAAGTSDFTWEWNAPPPEEMFNILSRYVAGIAETGICALLSAAKGHVKNGIWYDDEVIDGVLIALHDVAPAAFTNMILWSIENQTFCLTAQMISRAWMPPEVLARVATLPDVELRAQVAEHDNTPVETLVALASDPEPAVRRWVSINDHTPFNCLSRLVGDPDVEVRRWVALSIRLTPEIKARLAIDSNPRVRGTIASGKNIPRNLVETLARDPDASVRYETASNKGVSVDVIEGLAKDADPKVRKRAEQNLAERAAAAQKKTR